MPESRCWANFICSVQFSALSERITYAEDEGEHFVEWIKIRYQSGFFFSESFSYGIYTVYKAFRMLCPLLHCEDFYIFATTLLRFGR